MIPRDDNKRAGTAVISGQSRVRRACVVGAAWALTACVPQMPSMPWQNDPEVSRSAEPFAAGTQAALDPAMEDGTNSDIMTSLLARRSVLTDGPYARVADAVLAANARAAESELRAATLRAEARATNWLPTLGPTVSLTSLGDVVSSLVLDAVLFDNGRRKAERDYARADVEVAAVLLAEDSNRRVQQGLDLYLTAQQSLAKAKVNQDAMAQMERYAFVMGERVRGGVSSRVEADIVNQKLNQLRAEMASDRETAASAMAELAAMSAAPLDGIEGTSPMTAEYTAKPLPVLRAEAEASRAVAEAAAERAGLLPGLTGSVNQSGDASATFGGTGLGLGTGASIRASQETERSAAARVGQASEDADRRLQALQGQLASLQRQAEESQVLAVEAARNFETYAQQQREGQRGVADVVSIFETRLRAEREAAGLRFEVARVAMEIAALRGVLVDGDKI